MRRNQDKYLFSARRFIFLLTCLLSAILVSVAKDVDTQCFKQPSKPWRPTKDKHGCILDCIKEKIGTKIPRIERRHKSCETARSENKEEKTEECFMILWQEKVVKKKCSHCIYQEIGVRTDSDGSEVRIRRDLDDITDVEVHNLIYAYSRLMADETKHGYQYLCTMHSLPGMCPHPTSEKTKVCSIHGETRFLMWHRLITIQFEDALRRFVPGLTIPYWDWTRPFEHLINLVRGPSVYDPVEGYCVPNPFYRADIKHYDTHTIRTPMSRIFMAGSPINQGKSELFWKIIHALEQENLADFDSQLEDPHNNIHQGIGGIRGSFSDTQYAAYEPLFTLHHSFIDRLWIIWQKLQEYRKNQIRLPICMYKAMYKMPLLPFNFNSTYNPNELTHRFSYPYRTFDYTKMKYDYDSFTMGGMTIPELSDFIDTLKKQERYFASVKLPTVRGPARVRLKLCIKHMISFRECQYELGFISMAGGGALAEYRDQMLLHEITNAVRRNRLRDARDFHVKAHVEDLEGNLIEANIHKPLVIHKHNGKDTVHVSWDENHSNHSKIPVRKGSKVHFHDHDIKQLYTIDDFKNCNLDNNDKELTGVRIVDATEHIGDLYFVSNHLEHCSKGRKVHIQVLAEDQILGEDIPDVQREGRKTWVVNWGYSVLKHEYKTICVERDGWLMFQWCGPHHNVKQVERRQHHSCSFGSLAKPVPLTEKGEWISGSEKFDTNELDYGMNYFACTVSRHCKYGGMKIQVEVRNNCRT